MKSKVLFNLKNLILFGFVFSASAWAVENIEEILGDLDILENYEVLEDFETIGAQTDNESQGDSSSLPYSDPKGGS